MSKFAKNGIIVNAQEYSLWKHKLNTGNIGRFVAEKLFNKYRDQMDILRELDNQLRQVALGQNSYNVGIKIAFQQAKEALAKQKLIDAVYFISVIADINAEMVATTKQTVDMMRGQLYESLSETDQPGAFEQAEQGQQQYQQFLEQQRQQQDESQKTVEAQVGQWLYQKFLGDPLEKAWGSEVKKYTMPVDRLLKRAESYLTQLLAIFDRMGVARAGGKIDAWMKEHDKLAALQPQFAAEVGATYGTLKPIIEQAKKNKEHMNQLGDPATYEQLEQQWDEWVGSRTQEEPVEEAQQEMLPEDSEQQLPEHMWESNWEEGWKPSWLTEEESSPEAAPKAEEKVVEPEPKSEPKRERGRPRGSSNKPIDLKEKKPEEYWAAVDKLDEDDKFALSDVLEDALGGKRGEVRDDENEIVGVIRDEFVMAKGVSVPSELWEEFYNKLNEEEPEEEIEESITSEKVEPESPVIEEEKSAPEPTPAPAPAPEQKVEEKKVEPPKREETKVEPKVETKPVPKKEAPKKKDEPKKTEPATAAPGLPADLPEDGIGEKGGKPHLFLLADGVSNSDMAGARLKQRAKSEFLHKHPIPIPESDIVVEIVKPDALLNNLKFIQEGNRFMKDIRVIGIAELADLIPVEKIPKDDRDELLAGAKSRGNKYNYVAKLTNKPEEEKTKTAPKQETKPEPKPEVKEQPKAESKPKSESEKAKPRRTEVKEVSPDVREDEKPIGGAEDEEIKKIVGDTAAVTSERKANKIYDNTPLFGSPGLKDPKQASLILLLYGEAYQGSGKVPKLTGEQLDSAGNALSDALDKKVKLYGDLSSLKRDVEKDKGTYVGFNFDPNLVNFQSINNDEFGDVPGEEDLENMSDEEMMKFVQKGNKAIKNRSKAKPEAKADAVDDAMLKLSHKKFYERLERASEKKDIISMANLMLHYSAKMEDKDPTLSLKLLARAKEILDA